jgi:hypothetical protein
VRFIWTLKFVTSVMLEDTVRVRVAATDWPGWSLVPSWFHVKVIGPFAPADQLLVVMLRASETPLPVFLTYTVWVTAVPGVRVPQLMELKGTEQLEFE